jgi:hypothetical protein
MTKKYAYTTSDGRRYHMAVTWNPEIKLTEAIFPVQFQFADAQTGQNQRLPKEIATFSIGDPNETIGQRAKIHYNGDKDAMFVDYVEMAIRRATDYIERGK